MQAYPTFSVPPPLPTSATAKSSAVKAGWICVGLGVLTCWTLIGLAFFSVAMFLGVVAMCSSRVGAGLAILGASLCSLALCVFVMMGLAFGAVLHGVSTNLEKGATHRKPVSLRHGSLR